MVSTITTQVAIQNLSWRPSPTAIATVRLPFSAGYTKVRADAARSAWFRRTHVAHPLPHIGGYREQRQGGDHRRGERQQPSGIEPQAERAEHQPGKKNLR